MGGISTTGRALAELGQRTVRSKKVQGGLMNQSSGPAQRFKQRSNNRWGDGYVPPAPSVQFLRFIRKDHSSSCLVWTGAVFRRDGQCSECPVFSMSTGQRNQSGKLERKIFDARRYALFLHTGIQPDRSSRLVNLCGNILCVNQDHIKVYEYANPTKLRMQWRHVKPSIFPVLDMTHQEEIRHNRGARPFVPCDVLDMTIFDE